MKYILFDDLSRARLSPFTHTRPVADIRCGALTMRARWERLLNAETTGSLTENYLQEVYPTHAGDDNLYINGGIFATEALATAIHKLAIGQKLVAGDTLIAARMEQDDMSLAFFRQRVADMPWVDYDGEVRSLRYVWDIFGHNDKAIRDDFALLTNGRKSAPIPEGVTVSGKDNLFIEEGANIYPGCVINAMAGPVYIGKGAEILEGTLIRGPLAACEHSVIKMGAKIYGATTIGPGCKTGGEINNVVFFANSNKSHDGYLGNAVIGEWCNLGADTNCSNLKNNYDEVKIWSEEAGRLIPTGLTFCGLLMGDHSKCGINTMFNTGTVVGVSCNIYGGGFPDKFIPSFSWGGGEEMVTYAFDKAMDTAGRMMARRGLTLSDGEISMYRHVYDASANDRIIKNKAH